MTIRVGINGFGRIGRLALRAAWQWPDVEFVHVNDIGGDAPAAAHLLQYDSVHGMWSVEAGGDDQTLIIDGKRLGWSSEARIEDVGWRERGADVVLECTGKFRDAERLQGYIDAGVERVVVSAPVKSPEVPNLVMGVNDKTYDPQQHRIVSAASCTTNCLAPIVDVVHHRFGLRHGSITTIHAPTASQNVMDNFHKDWRRGRAVGPNLIPTTTGSAAAITEIFPELKGRIDGMAVRVPMANASLTDCVFELDEAAGVEAVNTALREAADGRLAGILGYEERPLVSVDFVDDTRSAVVDMLSTMVVDQRHVKILAWYDNEVGYANRLMELACKVGK